MKLFQLNFLGILILLLVASALIVLPSFVIENVWNSVYSDNINREMTINVWQASLLWGALVSLLYATGIFQFKLDFKTLEAIDPDSISDPELREEVERLKLKAQEIKKPEDRIKNKDDFSI